MAQINIPGNRDLLRPRNEQLEWKREFDALGPEGVRSALMRAAWEQKKRSAARQWLDRADSLNWSATRSQKGTPFMFKLHSAKWWALFAGILVFVMAIGRLIRKF